MSAFRPLEKTNFDFYIYFFIDYELIDIYTLSYYIKEGEHPSKTQLNEPIKT